MIRQLIHLRTEIAHSPLMRSGIDTAMFILDLHPQHLDPQIHYIPDYGISMAWPGLHSVVVINDPSRNNRLEVYTATNVYWATNFEYMKKTLENGKVFYEKNPA